MVSGLLTFLGDCVILVCERVRRTWCNIHGGKQCVGIRPGGQGGSPDRDVSRGTKFVCCVCGFVEISLTEKFHPN